MPNGGHGVGREGDVTVRIVVQDGLPQGNLAFVEQLGVRQVAPTVAPDHPVDKPPVLAQQPFQALLAARLRTAEDGWPFQGRTV